MLRSILLFLALPMAIQPALAGQELATATADYREVPREYRLDGRVEAVNQTTVAAQTGGQVEAILFDIDDYVEQGTVVVRLRDTEQRARATQAEADLQAAEARLQDARDEQRRIGELLAKKLVAQASMDKANTALDAAKAVRDAARAGVAQAREQLEYTRVRAPYSGIVTHRHVEIGEVAAPGVPLISGISLDQLRVSVDLPQGLVGPVRESGEAGILLPDGRNVPSRRLTIFPFASAGSNTFKVRLDLPEGDYGLFPGMFVKTTFILGSRKLLLVPKQAVFYRSEVTAVYVVGGDGRVAMRHVRTGNPVDGEWIAVIAGLDAGERVALDPILAGSRLKQRMGSGNDE